MIFIFLKEFNLQFFCASCNFRALVEILKEEVKVGLVLEVVQETQVPKDLKDILVSLLLQYREIGQWNCIKVHYEASLTINERKPDVTLSNLKFLFQAVSKAFVGLKIFSFV